MKLPLHVLLALPLFLLPLAARADEAKPAAPRPNILWLISEDTGPQLGCYGAKEVSTPNLDHLASEGVRYTHFYAGMVCSVSRSSFMTGMHALAIGAQNHRSHRNDGYKLPEGVRVLTDWMRDAGYYTANIRKMPPGCKASGSGKTDWNFNYEGKPFDTANWEDLKSHQPFFAQINFHETHRAYKAPKHADPAKVEIPPYYPDHKVTRNDWADYLDSVTALDVHVGEVLEQLKADGLADNTIVVYFGDNGISMARGKQFCYEEGFIVPCIVRWPKDFPAPSQIKPGTVDDRLLDAIDLAPTMLAIAGAAKPAKMQGGNFLGPQAEPPRTYVYGSRDRCDETVMCLRSVSDGNYRYILNLTPEVPFLAPNAYKEKEYPVWNLLKQLNAAGKLTPEQAFLCQKRMPAEELYDLKADPHEIHNLAESSDPAVKAELEKLRAALTAWREECHDPGPAKAGSESDNPAPPKEKKGKKS